MIRRELDTNAVCVCRDCDHKWEVRSSECPPPDECPKCGYKGFDWTIHEGKIYTLEQPRACYGR